MRYLVTGASGWFGSWIVPRVATAENEVFLESRYRLPPTGKFDRIIHCSKGRAAPWRDFLADNGRMIVCSSGAVDFNPTSPYAQGKMEDEAVPGVLIARLYTFIGPGIPETFAAGAFINQAHRGQPIVVKSSQVIRTYMWMGDMVDWLLAILEKGVPGQPYNVGSERQVSMYELAWLIAKQTGVAAQELNLPVSGMPYYVPDTSYTRSSLTLSETVPLEDQIKMTLEKL